MDVVRTEFTEDEKKQGYRVTVWLGKKGQETVNTVPFNNYECGRCAFDSLSKEELIKHLAKGRHPWGLPGGPYIIDTPVDPNSITPTDAPF
jgi:hypothetical protein